RATAGSWPASWRWRSQPSMAWRTSRSSRRSTTSGPPTRTGVTSSTGSSTGSTCSGTASTGRRTASRRAGLSLGDDRARDDRAGALGRRGPGRHRLLPALLRVVRSRLRGALRGARAAVARGVPTVRDRRRADRRVGLAVREPRALRRRADDPLARGVGAREDLPHGARDHGARGPMRERVRGPRVGRAAGGAGRPPARRADPGRRREAPARCLKEAAVSDIVAEIRAAYERVGVRLDQPATYGTYYRLLCAACGRMVGNVGDRLLPGMAAALVEGQADLYASGQLGCACRHGGSAARSAAGDATT